MWYFAWILGLPLAAAFAVLDGAVRPSSIPEKWDGLAAGRIVDVLIGQGRSLQVA